MDVQECQSRAVQLLMGFLTPNSSLWLHYVSFSLPCSVFARKHNLLSGVLFYMQATLHFSFHKLCPLSLTWAPAALSFCSELSADYSFPACFPTHYFPHPNDLTRTEFATLVCVFLGPSSLPSCSISKAQRTVFYACDDWANVWQAIPFCSLP